MLKKKRYYKNNAEHLKISAKFRTLASFNVKKDTSTKFSTRRYLYLLLSPDFQFHILNSSEKSLWTRQHNEKTLDRPFFKPDMTQSHEKLSLYI